MCASISKRGLEILAANSDNQRVRDEAARLLGTVFDPGNVENGRLRGGGVYGSVNLETGRAHLSTGYEWETVQAAREAEAREKSEGERVRLLVTA